MAKKDKTTKSNANDTINEALASIVTAALRGKLDEFMPANFLVSNKHMALLVKMLSVYEHYKKHDKPIDAELRDKTFNGLALIFSEAKPLTQAHMDMLVEGVELLEKRTNDMQNSAEWEDKHIAGTQYQSA